MSDNVKWGGGRGCRLSWEGVGKECVQGVYSSWYSRDNSD